jgi:hypothetical protein
VRDINLRRIEIGKFTASLFSAVGETDALQGGGNQNSGFSILNAFFRAITSNCVRANSGSCEI